MLQPAPAHAVHSPWLIRPRSGRFVLLIVIFIALAVLVAFGATSAPDTAVAKYFDSIQGGTTLDYSTLIVASFGDVTVLVLVGIILTIIRRTRKAGMIFLIAAVAVTVLVMYIKPVVGRPVPPYSFSPSFKLPSGVIEPDSLAPPADTKSFPSAHVAAATSFSFIIGQAAYGKFRRIAYALWAFPVVTGITRLYLLQHYPTDIFGGVVLGLVISAFLSHIMKLDVPFSVLQLKGPKGTVRDPSS